MNGEANASLLRKAAAVLSHEVGPWTLQNVELYPRVQLWLDVIECLGWPVDEIRQEILRNENKPFWAITLTRRRLENGEN